jgi:hypothetical protein
LRGRHADGSEFPIEVSLSLAATDNGAATVVIVRDVTQSHALRQAAAGALAHDRDEGIANERYDRVVGHIFGSALSLASVLSRDRLDDEDKRRLHDAINELDTAARALRDAAFSRSERDLVRDDPHPPNQ